MVSRIVILAVVLSCAVVLTNAYTCRNDRCCKQHQSHNTRTGHGYLQYASRCSNGRGTNCLRRTGCEECYCEVRSGSSRGKPRCRLPCV